MWELKCNWVKIKKIDKDGNDIEILYIRMFILPAEINIKSL